MPVFFRHHHSAVGAAACTSHLAAVQLTRSRFGVRIERAGLLSMQQDGLLTEQEFQFAAQEWLREHSFTGLPACCSLPQSQVNAVVTEFPQTHSRQKLARMVEYQIHQLCGLTDERFLSDYHVMPDEDRDTIPIVLAVSRARQVEERLHYLGELGLRAEQLTASGLALYNAFRTLEQGHSGNGLQALLEVNPESVTVALVYGDRLSQLAAIPLGGDPTVSGLARQLALEVPAMAERWRRESTGALAAATGGGQVRLETIWLTGGHGDLALLAEHLRRSVPCALRLFGVAAAECPAECQCGPEVDGLYPALTTAYGLAIQALGDAELNLTILPELLLWQQRKMSLFPYMVTLYLLLVAALLFQAITFSYNIYHQREVLRQREAELDAIAELVPQVEAAYRDLEYQQLRMLPLVELSSRSAQYLGSIDTWQRLLRGDQPRNPSDDGPDNRWCVYLADNFSFEEASAAAAPAAGGERRRDPDARRAAADHGDAAVTPLLGALEDARAAAKTAEPPAATAIPDTPMLPPHVAVGTIPRLTAMYAGGWVVQDEASYLTLKKMQESLNDTALFANVDDYVDFIAPGFMNRYLAPWEHFLVMRRDALNRNYTLFFLKMPLRESAVNYTPEEPE